MWTENSRDKDSPRVRALSCPERFVSFQVSSPFCTFPCNSCAVIEILNVVRQRRRPAIAILTRRKSTEDQFTILGQNSAKKRAGHNLILESSRTEQIGILRLDDANSRRLVMCK